MRELFGIAVDVGPLEACDFNEATFGAIVLKNVAAHFADPVETFRQCRRLLVPEGVLLIETPLVPPDLPDYDGLRGGGDPFIDQLRPIEHMQLFSERGLERALRQAGFDWMGSEDEPVIVAAAEPVTPLTQDEIAAQLLTEPEGRLLLALLDQHDDRKRAATRRDMDRQTAFQQLQQIRIRPLRHRLSRALRYLTRRG